MTADEYFAIALPTREDFRAWTASLFERADRLNARIGKTLKTVKGTDLELNLE